LFFFLNSTLPPPAPPPPPPSVTTNCLLRMPQLVNLNFANDGPHATELYNLWYGSRLAYNVYQNLSGAEAKEQAKVRVQTYGKVFDVGAHCLRLQQAFYGAIVEYVKQNPRSTDAEKAAEIKRQTVILTATLTAIEKGTLPPSASALALLASSVKK